MWVNRELVLFVKHMASQSIKREQPAMLLGGHHGQTSKFLVSHMAEMHGKWLMVTVISDSAIFMTVHSMHGASA